MEEDQHKHFRLVWMGQHLIIYEGRQFPSWGNSGFPELDPWTPFGSALCSATSLIYEETLLWAEGWTRDLQKSILTTFLVIETLEDINAVARACQKDFYWERSTKSKPTLPHPPD